VLREENREGSKCADLGGTSFHQGDDNVKCHHAHRENRTEQLRRAEFPQPPGLNGAAGQQIGWLLPRRWSRYHKPGVRTAPSRQSMDDLQLSGKLQKLFVGLGYCLSLASSFRPCSCHSCSCRQAPSLELQFAPHGNPSSSQRTRRRDRTRRPMWTPTAAAPRSRQRICA